MVKYKDVVLEEGRKTMKNYPNYRVAVEIVILHNEKILITKRADNCTVGAGAWAVPSGKVKYDEIPIHALYREAKEETNLDVEIIKELNVRTFQSKFSQEDIYRLVYTYLVKPKNECVDELDINEEHSEYFWVDKMLLRSGKFSSAHEKLLSILDKVLT